jgi:hypothetical protein
MGFNWAFKGLNPVFAGLATLAFHDINLHKFRTRNFFFVEIILSLVIYTNTHKHTAIGNTLARQMYGSGRRDKPHSRFRYEVQLQVHNSIECREHQEC